MGLFIHKNTRCRVYTGEGKSGFQGVQRWVQGRVWVLHTHTPKYATLGEILTYATTNNLCSCSGFQRSGLQDGSGESIHKETKVTTRNKLMKKTLEFHKAGVLH